MAGNMNYLSIFCLFCYENVQTFTNYLVIFNKAFQAWKMYKMYFFTSLLQFLDSNLPEIPLNSNKDFNF